MGNSQDKRWAGNESSPRSDIGVGLLGLMLVMGVLAVVYAILFWQTRMWQYLALIGLQLVGCAGVWLGRRMAVRGREAQATRLMVGVVLLLIPSYALVFSGAASVLAAISLVFPLVLVGWLWPRWRFALLTLAFGVLSGAVAVAVDAVVPWDRLDVGRLLPVRLAVYGGSASVVVLVLWYMVSAYRRIGTIRVRLTLSMILLALLVAAVVGGGAIWLSWRYARQQAFHHLETVAELKRRAIDVLLANDERALALLVEGDVEGGKDILQVLVGGESATGAVVRLTVRERFVRQVRIGGQFDEIYVINRQGNVVLSSDPLREGRNYAREEYFRRGLVSPGVYPIWREHSVVFVRPIYGDGKTAIGVIVARADVGELQDIVLVSGERLEGGEAYLVDADLVPLTDLQHEFYGAYIDNPTLREAIAARKSGTAAYNSYDGRAVLAAYRWLPSLRAMLVVERELGEVTAGARATMFLNGGLAIFAVLVAVVAADRVARTISNPLAGLARVATRIAGGELDLVARIESADEVGVLARAFNNMTTRLRELVATLEERVAERTRGLQAAAEVSRATTSLLDPDLLLRRVVEVIRERFDLYYVGLFLVDEERRYAVLRAGTGRAGREMLARGHRLEVGGNSMIGQCVAQGEARIALDVGAERVHFDNPWLPDTRSELALPLRARGRVIGAMTVQSTREAAFSEADIAVMQTMADQVAVAIDNARLFAEMQRALDEVQSVHRRYLGQAWEEYVSSRPVAGYEYAGEGGDGIRPLDAELLPEVQQVARERRPVVMADEDGEAEVLVMPVVRGDRVVAALGLERAGRWDREELSLVEEIALQFGLAADNLRLLDESQRRAARERVTREIVERIRAALDMEEILEVAARSLSRELAASEVVFRLGTARTLLGRGRDEG